MQVNTQDSRHSSFLTFTSSRFYHPAYAIGCIKRLRVSITIRELAHLAGVSPSTVSRSLNDSPLIPEETRLRIRDLASAHGYTFNANARSLSLGRTGTVALIFPDYFESFSISLFFTALQRHVRANLEARNLDVLVAFPFNRFAQTSNIEKLVRGSKVDGMIIVDNEFASSDRDCLSQAGIPYLFLHKHPDASSDSSADAGVNAFSAVGADYFCADHFEGGRLAAERLISLGRRHFLVARVAGEEFDARSAGFLQGVKDSGLDDATVEVMYAGLTFDDGYSQVGSRALASGSSFDGIFCQSDLMALGAMSALVSSGVRIPEDVSVVGYDDIELGRDFHPSLTTIRQPLERIASLACERLAQLMDSGGDRVRQTDPIRHLVKPELVIRES